MSDGVSEVLFILLLLLLLVSVQPAAFLLLFGRLLFVSCWGAVVSCCFAVGPVEPAFLKTYFKNIFRKRKT